MAGKSIVGAACAIVFALAQSAGGALAQTKKELTYVYATASAYYWDYFAADQLGYYAAEGIKVNGVKADNVAQQMQMLVTNTVQIAGANAELVLTAVDRGAKLAIVGGESARQGFIFVVRPEIRTFADLRGKTLGVTQLQEASGTMLQMLLARHGVKSDEFKIIALGGTPNRYAALVRGAVAGTMLSPPANFKAEENGMRRMGAAFDVFSGPQVVFTVNRDWAAKNADLLVAFLRATARAQAWLYDPKNRDRAADILVKAIGGTRPYALKTYEMFFGADKVAARGLEVTPAGIKAHLDIKGSKEDPDKYLDLSYMKRALGR